MNSVPRRIIRHTNKAALSSTDEAERWLGDIPAHWQVKRLSSFCEFQSGKAHEPFIDPEGQYVCVNARFISTNGAAIKRCTENLTPARPGDILMVMSDLPNGRALARSFLIDDQENYAVNQRVCRIRPQQGSTAYFNYQLNRNPQLLRHDDGKEQTHLSNSDFKLVQLLVPPETEQRRIARFLDEKTALIDALIEKKRALLDRLAEKRQALMTRAVTKGLNPDAPMKPSGIDWLGNIPAHWTTAALGHRYEVQLGRMLNAQRASGDNLRPYLRVFDVQWGKINVDDLPLMDFPPEAQQRYRLEVGDLLVNEGGSYVGRSAIWRGELEECYYQKALHRLRPFSVFSDTAEFLYYVMEAATTNMVFVAGGNQTTIDHLTAEQLRHYVFAFPPFEEQQKIACSLAKDLGDANEVANQVYASMSLFEEYRAALVTAAVTGQLSELQ